MFCSNCGSKLADGAKFCSECGFRVASADEQSFRTIADIDLEEPVLGGPAAETEVKTEEVHEDAPNVEPKREHISFDWSNVVDEPHKKEIPAIKSPWEDTGEINEQELFEEMTPSSDKSRTMSFIDVLRAEKEEKEKAAADSAIEYTEVLEIGQDLSAFDEAPKLHVAPLYEDVDEPVKTPFDIPEDDQPEDEHEEAEIAEEPKYEDVEVSRETIAQFDEYVKSFEKEAGILGQEPRSEKPLGGVAMPKFELPDFLKRDDEKKEEQQAYSEDDAEPAAEHVAGEDANELFEEYDIKFDESPAEEPTFEFPTAENENEEPAFEEPKYEDYNDGLDLVGDADDSGAEDLYLDLDNFRDEPSAEQKTETAEDEYEMKPKHGAPAEPDEEDDDEEDSEEAALQEPVYEEDVESIAERVYEEDAETVGEPDGEQDKEEADEPVDEAELFEEINETAPKHSGMTIAEPADTQSEIDALKRRLAELMGTPVEDLSIETGSDASEEAEVEDSDIEIEETSAEDAPETEPEDSHVVEPEASEAASDEGEIDLELYLEPEDTSDIDNLFEGLVAVSQAQAEPKHASEEIPEEITEGVELTAEEPAVDEIPVINIEAAEPEEVKPMQVVEEAAEEPAIEPEPVHAAEEPVVEAQPLNASEEIIEEIAVEASATEAETVADEVTAVEEASVEIPSDALSLEDLEKDLFGDVPEGEVEETKKIDKFYTLYKKNEEFQRLLDEEYEKLKNGGDEAEAKAEPANDAEAPAQQPAEDKKAYRQVEDETIYMPKEEIEKQTAAEIKTEAKAESNVVEKAETKSEAKPLSAAVFHAKSGGSGPTELDASVTGKAKKSADKAAKKAAKKAEKNAALKNDGEYDDTESGSGALTILAVIIAIILVILLAVIVILSVAPNSGIGIWINSHIQNITSGIGAIHSDDGQFLI